MPIGEQHGEERPVDNVPADHAWSGDEDGHNCAVCVERDDTLNMCWQENHLSLQGELRVAFAKAIGEQTGITEPSRLLALADAAIAGARAGLDATDVSGSSEASPEGVAVLEARLAPCPEAVARRGAPDAS